MTIVERIIERLTEYSQLGRSGSITIHVHKGEPRKVDWRVVEDHDREQT